MIRTEDLEMLMNHMRSMPGFNKPMLATFSRLQHAINDAGNNLVNVIDFYMVQEATGEACLLPEECRAILYEVRHHSFPTADELEAAHEHLGD
jgi:hypothetical protein